MSQKTFTANEYIRQRLARGDKETVSIDNRAEEDREAEYLRVFEDVQQYVTREKLEELTELLESGDTTLLKTIIENYLTKKHSRIKNNGPLLEEYVRKCVADMTGFGFLNKYFARKDEIEEININAWDIVEVRWCNGTKELTRDKFHSPQHARDVIKRILRQTGKYLDENKIYEVSYIGKSVRITTVITPVVDEEIGVAASIRFIHSAVFNLDKLVQSGFLTPEMGEKLSAFLAHGVSICVCGATGSGKTTVCNALLEQIPNDTRVVTLEGGTREFELVRRDENGYAINNRVHMQTRPHRDAKLNVDLQLLLDLVLKFDPDIVVVGEMVSEEAFIASETARTGHTVMTTIHTNDAFDAYYRMFSLGIRKYSLEEKIMLKFMVDAFPIIVYTKRYPDGVRRVQSILEGRWNNDTGTIEYNELYHYNVEDNVVVDGKVVTKGEFVKINSCTQKLKDTMINNGASKAQVEGF
ncbi:MAG: CpaF family protein [Bacteroidaceae bacterium]|nr:CpaF family protein [Bacteroidaceae bacterium]